MAENSLHHEITYVLCPLGHKVVRGIQQCATCGLPIFLYERSVAEAIERFGAVAKEFVRLDRLFAFGLGAWGAKLLLTTLATHNCKSAKFATMGASSADLQNYISTTKTKMPKEEVERTIRKINHSLKFSADRMRGPWKQAEMAAEKDTALSDRISIMGLRETENEQVAVFTGALGESLVAGIGPYLSSLVKVKNPNLSRVFFGILPSADNPEDTQFNAYCGISGVVKSGLEAAVIMQDYELKNLKGISRSGNVLGPDILLPITLGTLLSGDVEWLQEFARISRSLRVQVFSPAFAYGRSYEIYNGLPNILEHSLYSLAVWLNPNTVLAAVAMARVPRRLLEKIGDGILEEQFTIWCKRTFPSIRGTSLKILPKEESSDRLDTLLLLGGADIDSVVKPIKGGYDEFKLHIEEMDLWTEYQITKQDLDAIEETLSKYGKRLSQILKK